MVVEGAPLAVHLECDAGDWRQLLWYDRRLMPGGTRLDFDRIRPTTLRPFGLMWRGPARAGQVVELRFGFSLRGVEQAQENLRVDCPAHRPAPGCRDDGDSLIEDPTLPVSGPGSFDARRPTPPPTGASTSAGSGSTPRRASGGRSSPPRSTTR